MNPLLSLQAELERAYAASDSYLAIVRRVHAECGPYDHGIDAAHPLMACPSCGQCEETGKINHGPACLWIAAETLLARNGEGKS